MGIALVEVGHGLDEPSVDSLCHIDIRGIGVDDGCQLVACLQTVGGIVEPVL